MSTQEIFPEDLAQRVSVGDTVSIKCGVEYFKAVRVEKRFWSRGQVVALAVVWSHGGHVRREVIRASELTGIVEVHRG